MVDKKPGVVQGTAIQKTRPQPPPKVKAIDELMRRSDTKRGQWNILLYGPPGSGKTRLLGTAVDDPRIYPLLVLDFEGGSRTLKGINEDRVKPVLIDDWKDYDTIFDYLSHDTHPYKSVAIDSISETHIYALLNIVDEELEKSDKRTDELEVQIQDYGKAMVMLRRLLREFRKLPMHCFFTALARTGSIPREGSMLLPAMFGQMANEVSGMFDVSSYLVNERVSGAPYKDKNGKPKRDVTIERRLYLQGVEGMRVKVRTNWNDTVPPYIVNPSLTTLFDTLEGKSMK